MMYWVHTADRSGPYLWEASPSARDVLDKTKAPMNHETLFLEMESGHLIEFTTVTRIEPYWAVDHE